MNIKHEGSGYPSRSHRHSRSIALFSWRLSFSPGGLAGAFFLCAVTLGAGTASIQIDVSKPGPALNPRMYGIFLEEINHGVDGGLYPELIANRAFEDSRPPEGFTLRQGRYKDEKGYDSGFEVKPGEVPAWTLIAEGGVKGTMKLETAGGLNAQTPYCLRLDVEDSGGGRFGVANGGFWGIGVRKGEEYVLSLHARGEQFKGPITVRLEDASGRACSEAARLTGFDNTWKQFKAALMGQSIEPKARLVILAGSPGRVWLDFVSLIPKKTWKNHGLRRDIAQMIADLKPAFVRFPGGCVVEGGTVETAYNWKLTVGPVEQRIEQWSAWNYRRTHGMGFHEYLQFCEDLGAEPLYVGFAGQTCLFREMENVPMSEMGWVLTNFLDAIEYANGPASSRWGALRAKSGHTAPFKLRCVEIGNENGTEEFPPRYRFVHDVVKAQHPEIACIADLSWIGRDLMKNCSFDMEDNHFYNSPQWFMANVGHYARRDRKLPPVYVGELAVTSAEGGDLKGNLFGALGEGVFLLGCERNADVVKMVSYAPLLAHVDGRSGWHGMIYHDGLRVFGTVSYYLWQLFGNNRPDFTLQTDVEFTTSRKPSIAGAIGVGTWETSAEFKDIRVEKDGQVLLASDFAGGAQGWKTDEGRWSVVDGAWRQGEPKFGLSFIGDETWTDYTLTAKARKLRGGEGFLIVFGRKNGDQYWWNLGGWGNRDHAIEWNRSPVGPHVAGHIETDRWYDVKVELKGNQIRCYLDGKLVHDEKGADTGRFFALAGREKASGEIILKAVNTASEAFATKVQITGIEKLGGEAQVTVLKSDRLDANNSMENSRKVVPSRSEERIGGLQFEHEFPAYSLTLMRVKAK